MVQQPRINLQPHLGDTYINRDYNKSMHIYLAKILRVHHKHNTADVQLIYSRNVISDNAVNEGKYSARITVPSAHFDPDTLTSSGVIEPYQEGQMVMVAFLEESQSVPVILGSFHDTFRPENNILPAIYPVDPRNSLEELREHLKYLRVHPSQFYHKIDGVGAMEMSHPSGTFLKVDPDLYSEITDEHEGFDNDDLSEKNPVTGQPMVGVTEETTLPVKLLLSHKSDNIATDGGEVKPKWTKMFIDSDGTLRFSRDSNDNTLAYFEMSSNGGFTLRKQFDSNTKGSGKSTSEIAISEAGDVKMARSNKEGKESRIQLTKTDEIEIAHYSGSGMVIDQHGNVSLDARTMRLFSERDTVVHIGPEPPLDRRGARVWVDTSDIE